MSTPGAVSTSRVSRNDLPTPEDWRIARRRDFLRRRARVVNSVRNFFVGRGYLEVETPHRIPAPAPECFIEAVPSGDWFLHTSPELCMKRLLAEGHARIFQICRCFRQGEFGSRHLPEFTMLEWYREEADYRDLMSECEELVTALAQDLDMPEGLIRGGRTIDIRKPWERLMLEEAFERYAPVSLDEALAVGTFDELMAFEVEPRLSMDRPVFICDFPVSLGALARRNSGNPEVAERFELYIGGLELVNAFSELTDAGEQRERFLKEEAKRRAMGKRPYPMPEKFLHDLAKMPESAGAALGMDRLVMLFTGAEEIGDVVAFRPEEL